MRHPRRGLSPIVSVILLILVAVGATVIIYSWLSGAASNNPTQSSQLYERIRIDAVNVDVNTRRSTTTVTMYVHNLGKSTVTISSAYVINATSGAVICDPSKVDTRRSTINIQIPSGSVGQVSMVCPNTVLPSGIYVAKVVTTNGVEATYTFTV